MTSLTGAPGMIRLRNVERVYRAGPAQSYVLRRIDLDVRQGEFLTIMGPSGAGKSTLLGILGMLDSTWSGEYHFLGEPVHALPGKQRVELNKRYIGFVFQKYHLIDDLTVYENLEIPLSYRNVKPKERAAMVGETLTAPRVRRSWSCSYASTGRGPRSCR